MQVFISQYKRLQNIIGVDLFNTILVTGALFLVSFISYILQFYLGRTLSVEGFGDFTALLTIAGILAFVGNVISYATIKMYSELKSANDLPHIKWLFKQTMVYSAFLGLLLGALTIILSSIITDHLNITSNTTVIYFGLHLAVTFVPIFIAVYLQGIFRFVWLSIFIVLSAILRLLFPVAFLSIFYYEPGFVYFGFFLALVLSALFGYIAIQEQLKKVQVQSFGNSSLNTIIKSSLFNGLALFTLTTMISVDIIAVKYYFTPYDAGIYSGVVTLGKVIIFGAGTVATVMFPKAAFVNKNYIAFKSVLKKFGLIQILFVLAGAGTFILFPQFITHALFGEKFNNSVPYLRLYSIFGALYVLSNFMVLVLVALGEKKFTLFVPFFLLIQILGILFYHNSLSQIILVGIVSILLLLVFVIFNILIVLKNLSKKESLNVS